MLPRSRQNETVCAQLRTNIPARNPWTGLRLSLEPSCEIWGKEILKESINVITWIHIMKRRNTQVLPPSPRGCQVARRRYLKALSPLSEKFSSNSTGSEHSSREGQSFTIYWAPVHLLFGSMPFKIQNKTWLRGEKKIGPKRDHYSRAPVFFHYRDRPAKSIIISSSFFFLKLKPDKFRTRRPWKMHSTDSFLCICCVRSCAACWGSGSQSKESLPSQTLESSVLFWKLLYLKETIFRWQDYLYHIAILKLEKRSELFGNIKILLWT